jgi:hypothetical protein
MMSLEFPRQIRSQVLGLVCWLLPLNYGSDLPDAGAAGDGGGRRRARACARWPRCVGP